MKEHFKESVLPHTRECQFTLNVCRLRGKWCPHFRCLPTCQISRVQHTAHRWKLYHFDDFLASYMVFCSLIWREHLDRWWALSILGCGKISTKSGVLPKRIYPTRQIETLRLLRCDAVGRKNAAKLINCKLPSGLFSELAFLGCARVQNIENFDNKRAAVDWKHFLTNTPLNAYALHKFNSNQSCDRFWKDLASKVGLG